MIPQLPGFRPRRPPPCHLRHLDLLGDRSGMILHHGTDRHKSDWNRCRQQRGNCCASRACAIRCSGWESRVARVGTVASPLPLIPFSLATLSRYSIAANPLPPRNRSPPSPWCSAQTATALSTLCFGPIFLNNFPPRLVPLNPKMSLSQIPLVNGIWSLLGIRRDGGEGVLVGVYRRRRPTGRGGCDLLQRRRDRVSKTYPARVRALRAGP